MPAESRPDSHQQTALSLLYSDHHGWLFGWLRRRLGCSHNAADVAHDTFTRILASSESLGLREPRAFLATVARRLLIDRARRQRIEQAYLDELLLMSSDLDGFPSAEQVACAIEALEQIARALDGLPAGPRGALLLRHLDDYSHQQIAEHFQVSTKTVQTWLVKAMLHCHSVFADRAP
ncbi:sigma-70 family RNA polymerase sigma factor [Phytopseudomonas dryadis]|uniref:RNA polymerase subunit sigma n=1 Tax=Phytopseudomonas dryadis TaxID=2487520 RepID=A0A4Q9R3K3_9GAMM|nr:MULTISPECIES: sigma-70 family RNA polymerase sigma factor [Pseudomonas]TBU94492.1 RNA polymerase subunit sigma [Pseudomonas dryadis]TBV05940.1 RNA polymerase subunit sigma [Pseudomonas dryadis]TBV18082.1 RNA polymerase subunit sigma [Pseudomonas sp. FRB 230]